MIYKGKEIDDNYLINRGREEVIFKGFNNHESFSVEEFKDLYNKSVAKEKELTYKGIEHTPVYISVTADRGNDYADDFMEIALIWNENENEKEHEERIRRKKALIDKEVEEEEQKRISEKLAKEGALKDAIAMIEKLGGTVKF